MLNGKTVIVTGAAKGIGAAVALRFAREKANIVVNYNNTPPAGLLDQIKETGVETMAVQSDVGDFGQAKDLIEKAKEAFGTVDVLVNNAGITRDNLLMGMKEEEFDEVIRINLKGTFNTVKHVTRHMLKQKSGAIINVSSVIGLMGNMGQANYAASKAGIIGLTKSAARELASRNITVNAIAPGFIETDMTGILSEELKEKILSQIPLKRMGHREEVAEAAVFLAKNRYITGQVLNVDGGMVMQ